MGQGRTQGGDSQQEEEFEPQSPDFATLVDGEQNMARCGPRLSQWVSLLSPVNAN